MDVGGSERDVRSQQQGQAADGRADARASRPSERRAGSGRLGSAEWGRLLASPRRLPRRTETRPAAATSSFPPINSSSAAPRPSSHALLAQAHSRSVAAPVCASSVPFHSLRYNIRQHRHRPHVQRQRQVVVLHAERLQAPRQPRRDPEPSHLWRPPLRQCLRPCPSPLARAHAPKTARPSPPPAAATRTPTPTPRTPRSPPVSSGSPRTTGAGPDASPQSRPAPPPPAAPPPRSASARNAIRAPETYQRVPDP